MTVIARTYTHVLFDWDGCLVRSLDVWLDAYRTSLATLGLTPSDRDIAAQFGDWDGVRAFGVTDDQYAGWKAHLLEEVNAGLLSVELYPGARELVAALHAGGVATALVTTGMRSNLDQALARTGMASHFDAVLTAEDTVRHKPDPEPLLTALARLGGRPEDAVMVGDSVNDLGAARAAGTDSVLMYPAEHATYHDLALLREFDPTHICESFADLGDVLGIRI